MRNKISASFRQLNAYLICNLLDIFTQMILNSIVKKIWKTYVDKISHTDGRTDGQTGRRGLAAKNGGTTKLEKKIVKHTAKDFKAMSNIGYIIHYLTYTHRYYVAGYRFHLTL